jgi:hypothetical protein
MQLPGSQHWKDARARFERAWATAHPSTAPPSLYPEHPEDPLWVEADAMMDAELQRVPMSTAVATEVTSAIQSSTWTFLPGHIGCPRGHTFSMSHAYCPSCGAGPVPQNVAWEAEQAAIRLGARTGFFMARAAGG